MIKIETFGWEIEFPIVEDGQFISWTPKLEKLSEKIQKSGLGTLYKDGTPCAEYATRPHTNLADIIDECKEVFQQVLSIQPGAFFVGSVDQIESTFSGHIHIGNKTGLTNAQILKLREALQGSQSFIELISQNVESVKYADDRACRKNYFAFYTHPVKQQSSREYLTFTLNEHKTVENRIPPSTDFYHLAAITAVELAWVKKYANSRTFDLESNWFEATRNGINGKYITVMGNLMNIVDYSTFVNIKLASIEDELEVVLESVDEKIKKRIYKYLDWIKLEPISKFLSEKTILEMRELTKKLVFEDISIFDVFERQIPENIKKFSQRDIKDVMDNILVSSELNNYLRLKSFVAALSKEDPNLASPKDVEIVKKILKYEALKNVI